MATPTSFKEIATGRYVVIAADVTATFAQMVADLASITGVVYNIYRAGVALAGGTMTVQTGANVDKFRIASGGGYTLTAGDVIKYIECPECNHQVTVKGY